VNNFQSKDALQQVPMPTFGDQLENVPTETPAPKETEVEGVRDERKALTSPLEIHSQTTVIRRCGFEMFEDVIPAFIKISTGFKAELKNIDGTALKVWIYLALSINRNTEQAHPGIRTIAEACGIGQNTAIAAVRELESLGLLVVNREDRKYNIYEIPAYVSANARPASKTEAGKETASEKPQTASGEDETASQNSQTASEKPQTASVTQRLNQINQINQNEPGKPRNFSKLEISSLFWNGQDLSQVWKTVSESMRAEIPRQSKNQLGSCVPVAWDAETHTLTVQAEDPEWLNQRISRTAGYFLAGVLDVDDPHIVFIPRGTNIQLVDRKVLELDGVSLAH
jgi:hypothetical protein